MGEHKDIKFAVQVDYSKSQPMTTNCPWKGSGHVTWLVLNF